VTIFCCWSLFWSLFSHEVRFGPFTPAASGEAALAQVPMLRAFPQLQKQKRPAADPGPGHKFTNSFAD
jgi:hypothetical protein